MELNLEPVTLLMTEREGIRYDWLNILIATKNIDEIESVLGKRTAFTDRDRRVEQTASMLLAEACIEQFERQVEFVCQTMRTAAVLSRTEVKNVTNVLVQNVRTVVLVLANTFTRTHSPITMKKHAMKQAQRMLKNADDLFETGAWYNSPDGKYYVVENIELRGHLRDLVKINKKFTSNYDEVDKDLAHDIRLLTQRVDKFLEHKKRYTDPFMPMQNMQSER